MSALDRSLSWLERAADWANPILVKETRQSLKSRQFVLTFMLMLAVSWFLFVLGVVGGGSALEYGAIGSQFFEMFYWILGVAVMIVVPFSAQRSLLSERDQSTYDLLSITTLTPRQIVWGKLLSALVQVLIFYSAIAPFIAFTSLLQGFDLVFVASKLVLTLLLSLFVTMLAIAASTTVNNRQWQGLAWIGGLAGTCWLSMSLLVGLDSFLRYFDPASLEQWAGLVFMLVIGTSYFVLFQKIATAQLTFEADDRSSGIRLVCSVQFFLLWIGLLVYSWVVGHWSIDGELVMLASTLSAIHLAVVGLFATTEESFLSRRVRRNLPANSLRRLLHAPFLQGGARGYLYVLIHLALFLLATTCAIELFVTSSRKASFEVLFAMAAYLAILLGIASALGRWLTGLSPDIRPSHVRVLSIILFAAGCIAPYIPLMWGHDYYRGYSLLLITNPIHTLAHLSDNGDYRGVILSLLAAGVIGVLIINFRPLRRGIAEVVFADVSPRSSEIPDPLLLAETTLGRAERLADPVD